MTKTFLTVLLWFSAIGCGVMAGVYFAFSAFIMTSLGRIDQSAGIAAFNAINVDIVKSSFIPIFMGTTIASVLLAVMAFFHYGDPGSRAILAGSIIYIVGMFVVTVVFNIPLNNTLVALNPSSSEAGQVWSHFLQHWTFWNHVRTLASLGSCALFVWVISVI